MGWISLHSHLLPCPNNMDREKQIFSNKKKNKQNKTSKNADHLGIGWNFALLSRETREMNLLIVKK